jgi:hypothetical protein
VKFLYNHKSDSATLTASSAQTGFTEINLQDTRASRVYRSADGTTSINIVFDFGSAVDFNTIAIANHNITTSETTFKLEYNSSDSWGVPAGSTNISAADSTIFHTFSSVTYRYARLVIDDDDISDGYIEIGRVSIGEYFDAPQVGIDLQLPRYTTSNRSFSRGRQAYFDEGVRYRAISLQFNKVTTAEYNSFNTMFPYSDIQPVFCDFDELSNEEPLYCVVSNEFNHSYVGGFGIYTLNMDIEEVN